ncbi:MAG: YbaK/EbsC family protein [Melioribacteraceae bacterium]|nr:MAG: YbaK/EbsC family protein [Melioribacteraceae bacterium]
MELSKNSKIVQDYLAKFELNLEVVEMPVTTRTAEDAAKAIGCEVGQILKSLIFKNGESPLLCLVSGKNQLDIKKFEERNSIKLEKADANFVKEVTGFSIGGIPPVALKTDMQTFIDKDLFSYDVLWGAAGMPFSVFKLFSKDLQKITNGKIIAVN